MLMGNLITNVALVAGIRCSNRHFLLPARGLKVFLMLKTRKCDLNF